MININTLATEATNDQGQSTEIVGNEVVEAGQPQVIIMLRYLQLYFSLFKHSLFFKRLEQNESGGCLIVRFVISHTTGRHHVLWLEQDW